MHIEKKENMSSDNIPPNRCYQSKYSAPYDLNIFHPLQNYKCPNFIWGDITFNEIQRKITTLPTLTKTYNNHIWMSCMYKQLFPHIN